MSESSFELLDLVDPWRIRKLFAEKAQAAAAAASSAILPSPLPTVAAALDAPSWLIPATSAAIAGAGVWFFMAHMQPRGRARARKRRARR